MIPPQEPILRIETGMHTAAIRRIGVDGEERYLVTGSVDKTVRVWELSTARLIQVIRPPLGSGNEGKIYSVAISPDGRTIACGGWTDESNSIYLFEAESGRLSRRIKGLPQVIYHLAYSRDGRFLVATLGGSNGIRIYRIPDYSLTAEDRDYGADSYGAGFDISGRLVTTSLDGFIRLYDSKFNLIAKKKAPGGNQPLAVSFSPDGSEIAVGFTDSTKVNILSGKDLSYLFSPDTAGVNNGYLSSVCWSSDGARLYAGGGYNANGMCPIRKWENKGRGKYIDLSAADDTIMSILALKAGGIAFGSADPAFGVFDANDKRVVYQSSYIPDYCDNFEGFRISFDGTEVQFGYEQWGKSPAGFSIIDRQIELNPKPENLQSPVTYTEGLNITDWKDTYTPKLNNKALKLAEYEESRSLAISPDKKGFLLGADWWLRFFDRDGQEKWRVPVPGVVWCVNIPGNGKLAVAGFSDGTIRWYRLSDGRELLALFPHNDKKRWVIWTPSGYYDASIGGEGLIGWHINQGKEQEAGFFPISRFRDRYARPDVVVRVLETLDEKKAIRLADSERGKIEKPLPILQILPPSVVITPSDIAEISTGEMTVKYWLHSPSKEAVTGIRFLIDGLLVEKEDGAFLPGAEGEVREKRINLPERDCKLIIVAENRYSAGTPAVLQIRWKGLPKKEIEKPTLYILAIGISKYQDTGLTLNYADKDAIDFTGSMSLQKGGLYKDVVVRLITDERATRKEILNGFGWIEKQTKNEDVAMVFIAGHGDNDGSGRYYYKPVEVEKDNLRSTGVSWREITDTLTALSGKRLLFLDTCHSGNVMGKLTKRSLPDINRIVNELTSAENGVIVFTACSANQVSIESPAWENGAFTEALLEGINGRADLLKKGDITITTLGAYIGERVKELTDGKQTPNLGIPETIPDFPVAVVK